MLALREVRWEGKGGIGRRWEAGGKEVRGARFCVILNDRPLERLRRGNFSPYPTFPYLPLHTF